MSLFWRIYLLNAVVLLAATTGLLLAPVSVSEQPVFAEILVLVIGLGVLLVLDGVLFRIGLAPLRRLSRTMRSVNLLQPGPRPVEAGRGDIGELIRTFNSMLDRLESERGRSAGRALSAQEGERRRIAQELHDEIGQTLTAVLLDLKRVAGHAPPHIGDELHDVQETTRDSLDEIRRIAHRLRPGVLTELGLPSALQSLVQDTAERAPFQVDCTISRELPDLSDETELVIYRVAQEALTNITRHSGARRATVSLTGDAAGVGLLIQDDGVGMAGSTEGAGLQGMRERVLLIGATLTLDAPASALGTRIRLHVPIGQTVSEPA